MILDEEVGATQEVPSPGAEQSDHAKPPLDESRFHDQGRFQSSEITRAFASAVRAASHGPQSEVSQPEDISLDSDVAIVRGLD